MSEILEKIRAFRKHQGFVKKRMLDTWMIKILIKMIDENY